MQPEWVDGHLIAVGGRARGRMEARSALRQNDANKIVVEGKGWADRLGAKRGTLTGQPRETNRIQW
jgi:hypothetical protein